MFIFALRYDWVTAQRYEIEFKQINKLISGISIIQRFMDKVKIFKTDCQREREARDLAIYNEYNKLVSVKGQSKTLVTEHLMKKYGIHSQGTIYIIRRRIDAKLKCKGEAI